MYVWRAGYDLWTPTVSAMNSRKSFLKTLASCFSGVDVQGNASVSFKNMHGLFYVCLPPLKNTVLQKSSGALFTFLSTFFRRWSACVGTAGALTYKSELKLQRSSFYLLSLSRFKWMLLTALLWAAAQKLLWHIASNLLWLLLFRFIFLFLSHWPHFPKAS